MKKLLKIFIQLFLANFIIGNEYTVDKKYTPDWNSLDSRPLPRWFDQAKVGIFIHWGVFSVPSYRSEWFWWNLDGTKEPEFRDFVQTNYSLNAKYQDFANQFRAELWKPQEWAKLFKRSGAKYVVLTSKHHEGFALWNTKYSWNWNSVNVGPKRDIIKEFSEALRKENLFVGLYHSLYEWFNPNYLFDKANNFTTQTFSKGKTMPELYELVNQFEPELIWSDGEWEAPTEYWGSLEFLAWLYNESPVKDRVVVNDRWGQGTNCNHGGYLSCADRYSPGVLQKRKWENAFTIDRSTWGFSRLSNLDNYFESTEIIHEMVKTVSCGGNFLVNVGPRSDGTIDAIFQDRLIKLGNWLSLNGDAIYKSRPFKIQNDTITADVWYTTSNDAKKENIYVIFSNWPRDDKLRLSVHNHVDIKDYRALLINEEGGNYLTHSVENDETIVDLSKNDLLLSTKPWVLKFEDISD